MKETRITIFVVSLLVAPILFNVIFNPSVDSESFEEDQQNETSRLLSNGGHIADEFDLDWWTAPPSPFPNGGLIVDESDLDWGETWESYEWIERKISIKNPHPYDLHVSLKYSVCGFDVKPNELLIPASSSEEIEVSLRPSTYHPEIKVNQFEKPGYIRPIIEEFPGLHPGWKVSCRCNRVVAIDRVQSGHEFLITPLRPVGDVNVFDEGGGLNSQLIGPDQDGRYLLQCDATSFKHRQLPSLRISATTTDGQFGYYTLRP